ncbi:hypothetical protein APUTEX25_002332 [Auxenochlorella protothecoides]|uniref:Kinesin-like protein n=2 Tax=Auxenochlorella protothecoides TaxID=3075 RepID=A0A3M7L551_AUXPR|nr:hypothetical protein APUTEX25_002332 [Auxenochlorella protothecoides]|eukprot:RMZ57100.1 hypothetical protein APUTEX25_002332 [Auxenochlorella protothecoides]
MRPKPGGQGINVFKPQSNISVGDYEFDEVLPPSASQADVYAAAVRPIVEDVLAGYNGTVMAYGQTGAGKTHTLSSVAPETIGAVPRAAAEVFAGVQRGGEDVHAVYMSYVQIYMELIQDLLAPESENLQIREGEAGVFIAGVRQVEVRRLEDCLELLQAGDRNRTTAFTAMNAVSSRSHAVFMLTVVKRKPVGDGSDLHRVRIGKLFMVDLAGSERLKKSGSTGLRASEAKSINLSLTTLGMCINARADPAATHVPFRDSKLTRLLQDSLGGNAKTSLIVAVSDAYEHVEESVQSLAFGMRAMRVTTQPKVNERLDFASLAMGLKEGLGQASAAAAPHDARALALERSLLAQESELEYLQHALQAERERVRQTAAGAAHDREALDRVRAQEAEVRLQALRSEVAALQAEVERARGEAAAAEALRREEEARHASECAELRGAAAAAAAAAEQATDRLARATEEHAVAAVGAARRAEAERAAAAAAAAEAQRALEAELAGLAPRLATAEQQLAGSRRLQDMLTVQHEQQLAELQSKAEGELRAQKEAARGEIFAAQEGAARAECEARDTISRLEGELERSQAYGRELQQRVDVLEAEILQAADHSAHAAAALRAANESLARERELGRALQRRLAAGERSRETMAASWREHKRVSDAARTVQRAYRAYRLRIIRDQAHAGSRALTDARSRLGSLAAERDALARKRRADLAFSGQTLVRENLAVLQEGVESIVAAFLLPARDLKSLARYAQKVGGQTPGGLRTPTSAVRGEATPTLSRAGSMTGTEGLIRAFHPLMQSVRSTPRATRLKD